MNSRNSFPAIISDKKLIPVLEKLGSDLPDRFQINLNDISMDALTGIYDQLMAAIENGATFDDESKLTNFALLFGAKALQEDFDIKEQEKITDIRDFLMLGMARMSVQGTGGRGFNYDMTVWFHERGEIMGFKWNKFLEREFTLTAKKMEVYDQYKKGTYKSVVQQDRLMKKLVASRKGTKGTLDTKEVVSSEYYEDRQSDFFSVPEACYQELSLREMIEYSLYLVVEGDVKTYLQSETPAIQKFKNMLENGEGINVLELRAAWWAEEKQRQANTPKDPNVSYVGSSYTDKSQPH